MNELEKHQLTQAVERLSRDLDKAVFSLREAEKRNTELQKQNRILQLQLARDYENAAEGESFTSKKNMVHRILGISFSGKLNELWEKGTTRPNTRRFSHITTRRDLEICRALDRVGIEYELTNIFVQSPDSGWIVTLKNIPEKTL